MAWVVACSAPTTKRRPRTSLPTGPPASESRYHLPGPAWERDRVDIRLAGQRDLASLARLLWLHAAPDEQARQSVESFAANLDA